MRQQLPTNLNVISQGKRAHYHLDRKNTHSWVALLFIYLVILFFLLFSFFSRPLLFNASSVLFQVGILYFQPSVFRCILLRWVRLLGFATVYGMLTLKLYRYFTHSSTLLSIPGSTYQITLHLTS